MKNFLLVFTVIILDVMGCGPRRHEDPEPYLNVSTNQVILENQRGATGVIFVSSNLKWIVVSNSGQWLKISPVSGNEDARIIVEAQSSNESPDGRVCTLTVNGGGMEREVLVYQMGK